MISFGMTSMNRRVSVNVTNLYGTEIITNVNIRNTVVQLKTIMEWNENNKIFFVWWVTSLPSKATWGVERKMLSSSLWYSGTHENGSKLYQGKFILNIRKLFFTECVVNHWNRLSTGVANARSLSVFKRHLYDALNNFLYLWSALKWSGRWTGWLL